MHIAWNNCTLSFSWQVLDVRCVERHQVGHLSAWWYCQPVKSLYGEHDALAGSRVRMGQERCPKKVLF